MEVGEIGDRPGAGRFDHRWSLVPGLVREVLIIVLGVLGEDLGEMFLVEDQYLAEQLPAQRSDHALADRVRPRGLRRSPPDPHTTSAEDLVESHVTVPDQKG